MKSALASLSAGEAVVPLRSHVEVPQHHGRLLLMPCYHAATDALSLKAVTVLSGSEAAGRAVLPADPSGRRSWAGFCRFRGWQHVHRMLQRRLPVVLLDRIHPDSGCPSVGVDNYHGAFEATDYLIERGHRRIACIQRLPHAWINEKRVRGFRDAHQTRGIKLSEALILGDQFGQRNGYLEVTRFLDQQPSPTALFTLSHLNRHFKGEPTAAPNGAGSFCQTRGTAPQDLAWTNPSRENEPRCVHPEMVAPGRQSHPRRHPQHRKRQPRPRSGGDAPETPQGQAPDNAIEGLSEEFQIRRVTFQNVRVAGKLIRQPADLNLRTNEIVNRVRFVP